MQATRLRRLPALLALAFALPAQAANEMDEPLLVVTATRFADADPRIPANIIVIHRDEIANSPLKDLPSLLATRAGVSVRPLYGSLGIDAPVDLRGFGETGVSNTLILVDGQRINPVDSSNISWSSIPLGAVQRIEILRGAGTVLYGDRASGGVINIITDKSGKPQANLTASVGSFDYRSVDGHLAGSRGDLYGNLFVRHAATDGWRQNSQAEQNSASGRAGAKFAQGEVFIDYAAYADRNGLPGYQRSDVYRGRSTASRTPYDAQERRGYRLRPGVALAVSDRLRFEAEASFEHEAFHSNYVSFGSIGDRDRDSWSLTPRLIWKHGLGSLASETVAGLDHYVGDIDARYSAAANQGAKQTSTAAYLQNQTSFGAWTATLGARRQRMEQAVRQDAYAPFFSPAMRGSSTRERSAWDAGITYVADSWRIYGKVGTTFRFANTDELFGFDPFTGNPVFAGDLRPQHGTVKEVGGSFKLAAFAGKLSLFRMDLKDEIGFDGAAFANVNFDETRRQGLDAEIEWKPAPAWKAKLAYSHLEAEFRAGPYADKRVPLVPRDKGSVELSWDGGAGGRYTALVNVVGKRPYSGDFANTRQSLSGYTTLDLQAAWDWKPWTLSLRVLNALDKRYAAYAGYSTFIADHYYYPADRRAVVVTARYAFK